LSSILEDEWIDEHWDEMEKATNEATATARATQNRR
jgi:hypothetical protein